jgi:hypothetical protein
LIGIVVMMLAGCNTGRTLNLSRGLKPPADIPGVQQPVAAEPVQTATLDEPARTNTTVNTLTPTHNAAAPARSRGTIAFRPVIGAPLSAVQPLSAELGTAARENGLVINSLTSGASDHILVGYFSAFPDGKATTVAFVWDILDSAGTRLHRIRGQEQVSGTAGDPWTIVPPATMKTIADRTIDDYLTWRASAGT